MANGICVAVQGTVTISSEEYRDLVTAQAYLSVIAEATKSERNYIVDNIVKVISRLVSPVITAEEPSSEDSEGGASAE